MLTLLLQRKKIELTLLLIAAALCVLVTSCGEKRVGYDGAASIVFLSHDYAGNNFRCFKAPLKSRIHYDNERNFQMLVRFVAPTANAPEANGAIINGKQKKFIQWGQYDFTISSTDTPVIHKTIEYSGEEELTVARGIGWTVKIVHSPEWEELL